MKPINNLDFEGNKYMKYGQKDKDVLLYSLNQGKK